MKSIKKFLLVALAATLSISFTNAQVGLQAGYSSVKSTSDGAEAINGFHVGPVYNLTIQGPISLQYGLLYNMYMSNNTTNLLGDIVSANSKLTLHQLDIPVRVAASFPLASNISIFVFGGPNFNIGVAGTYKVSGSVAGIGDESSTSIYDNENLSRFNLQLGAGAGLQFGNFGVKCSYDWGMLDMNKSDLIDYKDNGLKASLFYNF